MKKGFRKKTTRLLINNKRLSENYLKLLFIKKVKTIILILINSFFSRQFIVELRKVF